MTDRSEKETARLTTGEQRSSEQMRASQLYGRRESHLAAVVEVQSMLLAAEGKNLPIDAILSLLGSVFHASRVYLVENRYDLDELIYMVRQHEWCAMGVRALKDAPEMQQLYFDNVIPNWRKLLSHGKMVAGIVADFPPEERRFLITQGIQSILILPLLVNGSFSGFLGFDDCLEPRQWQPSEISLLQVVATSLAMARERLETEDHLTSAYRELAQRLVELSTLNEIIQTVATVTDLRQALENIATKMCLLFDAVSCSISLLNAEQTGLRVIVQIQRDANLPNIVGETLPLEGNPASVQVIEQLQSLVIRDAQHNPAVASAHALLRAQGIECMLILPLLSRGKIWGTIDVNLDTPERAFTLSEVRLAEAIAGQVASAIENASLFQEAQEARSIAESSNRAKSAFLASMSHELRTPLNAILGFTQLLMRASNLTVEQRESLNTITRSGDHLLGLINDVLDLSKIEAGRITLQATEFDLLHLLRGLEEMLTIRAQSKGLLLRFENASDIPRYVRSDESKLRQILINLFSNAIKFTSRGSITLTAYAEPIFQPASTILAPDTASLQPPGVRLMFDVEDTGSGIPATDLERIFEPFVQSSQSSRAAEGTGLGLAISRQYARLLGGDLTAQSRLGFGSNFHLEVVVEQAAPGSLPVSQPPSRVVGLLPGQTPLRLLVAEDNEANRQLLVLLLTSIGFDVQGVKNGKEAVEVTEAWKPHLVWMDLRMPVMDGLEATRLIKAAGPGAPVVIALTAAAFEDSRRLALEAGCDDHITKPYLESQIFDALERHLGVRFLYETEQELIQQAEEGVGSAAPISASGLSQLEIDTLNRLGHTALVGDIISLEAVIHDIRQRNAPLALSLDQLANQFEYGKIHTLVQEALQEKNNIAHPQG